MIEPKRLLKAEMARRGLTNAAMAIRLGAPETEIAFRNKLSRGTFSATFFFQCMDVMNVATLRLD